MAELKISEEILNSAWYRDMMADMDEPEQWVAGRRETGEKFVKNELVRHTVESAAPQDTPKRLAS